MGQSKKRTAEFKESLFNKHKLLLEIIYYLSDGLMLEEHIIQFKAILSDSKSNTREDIKELLEEGFVKEKQVLLSNSRAIYLTKYPLAKIKKIKSRNVTSVRATEEKILNSLFRCEYILKKIVHVVKDKKLNRIIDAINLNANTVLVNKNNAINVYSNLKDIKEKRFANIDFDEDFEIDYKIVKYEKQCFLNRISNNDIEICNDYKDIKNIRDNKIEYNSASAVFDKNADYFNFKNLLSKSFGITTVREKDNVLEVFIYYFDLYNTADIYKIAKNTAYIYLMFKRYFKANIRLNLEIFTYSEKRANELRADANSKVKDFMTKETLKYRKAEKAFKNAKVRDADFKNISINYKYFDFYNKYKIKK